MDAATLHPPDSSHADFAPDNVPYERLMGQWFIIASTLPLWKNKRDVSITYTPIPDEPATTFDDLVQFHYDSAALGSLPWEVKGVDKLETDVEGNGVRWKWRGKGFLKISTSHWQLLGYSLLSAPPSGDTESTLPPPVATDPEWVVTYFSSTLFTPAGLDIYVRKPDALTEEQVEGLVRKLEGLGGEVEALVKDGGMFRVPHSSV
ncbi:hypothetical protein JCM6882_004495 [Rhodosporidiobolus microsporus]